MHGTRHTPLLCALLLLSALLLYGCTPQSAPAVEGQKDQDREVESLKRQLYGAEAALQAAQEEIRWLHIDLGKRPTFDSPRSAVEAYANALIRRNGATARVFLSGPMRERLNMPAHGIGVSNPHLKRYEILDEQKVADGSYRFKIRFYTEYTGWPEVPGEIEIYTVQSLKDDTGNAAWLIADIAKD